jgi:hypothetical protein
VGTPGKIETWVFWMTFITTSTGRGRGTMTISAAM